MLAGLVDWLMYSLIGLNQESRLIEAINYFIHSSIRIMLMLFFLIIIIGILRTYLPQEKIRQWMGRRGGAGNFSASLFGAVTPFCSCSSIPLFLGFIEAGVPLGITFSFLITSPLINQYLLVLMLALFGWKIMILYVLSGLLIGTFSGMVLGRMNLEPYLARDFAEKDSRENGNNKYHDFMSRVRFGYNESVSIVKKIWLWVLFGVGVGSIIYNYVPQEFVQSIIGKTGVFSVPIATILGVPMYGSCSAIVPIAVVLFQKGIPLGTALAFMMAIAALSLPAAIMLKRAMKIQLIIIFFGITTVAIILTGYLFNFLQVFLI